MKTICKAFTLFLLVLGASGVFAAETAAPAAGGLDISSIAAHVVQIVLIIFTPILGLVVTGLVRALAKHFHINASLVQDKQVEWAVAKGVNYAEEWARTAAQKPTGSEKADKAFEIVNQLLENSAVQEYGIDALRNLIKAKVSDLNAPAEN